MGSRETLRSGSDLVLGVETDELGVETVVMFALAHSSSEPEA